MKLDVDDCSDLPTSDAVHLSDHLIRLRFQRQRAVSQSLKFILEEGHSIATPFPDAPDRSAVEHNLRELRKSLDRAHEKEREKKGPFPIQSARDYALFNVEHHCNPAFLYPNGQAAESLVERAPGSFEVALHRELRDFLSFCDEYQTPNFISRDQVRRFGTLVGSRALGPRATREVQVSIIPMFRGDSSASLVPQRVGERPGDRR